MNENIKKLFEKTMQETEVEKQRETANLNTSEVRFLQRYFEDKAPDYRMFLETELVSTKRDRDGGADVLIPCGEYAIEYSNRLRTHKTGKTASKDEYVVETISLLQYIPKEQSKTGTAYLAPVVTFCRDMVHGNDAFRPLKPHLEADDVARVEKAIPKFVNCIGEMEKKCNSYMEGKMEETLKNKITNNKNIKAKNSYERE